MQAQSPRYKWDYLTQYGLDIDFSAPIESEGQNENKSAGC